MGGQSKGSSDGYGEKKDRKVQLPSELLKITSLKTLGVTHILNAAEEHVQVSPTKFAVHGIQYHGFHVDDLPECDISRYYKRSTDFINSAVASGGLVVVNCYMGLSRSA